MNTVGIFIGTLGMVFAIVITVLAALSFRKPRRISALVTLISGVIAAAALGLMILLGRLRLNPLLAFPTLLLGLLLGFLRGQAVRLLWQGNQVVGRNSILFLLLWGLSLAFSQLLGMLGSPLLASLGLIPAAFSTGLQIGFYANLFLRRLTMRRSSTTPASTNLPQPPGTLHTVFGIGGGLALFLLLLITTIAAAPSLFRTFPDLNRVELPADEAPDAPAAMIEILPTQEPIPEEPFTTPGLLPTTGSLMISCDAELQEDLNRETPYGGIEGEEYTFEEMFDIYETQMDMQVDFSDRSFTFNHIAHIIKNYLLYDPEYDDDPCPMYIDTIIDAEGKLFEDGWIAGNLYFYNNVKNCTGEMPDEGNNEFYGYIDDQLSSVVFCPLPVGSWFNLEEYTVDFETLRQQGKQQLISNWWAPDMCRTCTVEQVLP